MTTRFKNAIDALVYAFFNDTLAKGDCACCAVGNWIAWCDGKKVTSDRLLVQLDSGIDNGDWAYVFSTDADGRQGFWIKNATPRVLSSIESTGYSLWEVASVEKAFESATKIDMDDYDKHSKSEIMEDQYRGLCAVVEVLCELEGIEDPSEYKQLFAYQS